MTMSSTEHALLASYWGKADPNAATGEHDHHTVLGHSLDVAACAFVLIDENEILREQFASNARIPGADVAITVAAICCLHDIGMAQRCSATP